MARLPSGLGPNNPLGAPSFFSANGPAQVGGGMPWLPMSGPQQSQSAYQNVGGYQNPVGSSSASPQLPAFAGPVMAPASGHFADDPRYWNTQNQQQYQAPVTKTPQAMPTSGWTPFMGYDPVSGSSGNTPYYTPGQTLNNAPAGNPGPSYTPASNPPQHTAAPPSPTTSNPPTSNPQGPPLPSVLDQAAQQEQQAALSGNHNAYQSLASQYGNLTGNPYADPANQSHPGQTQPWQFDTPANQFTPTQPQNNLLAPGFGDGFMPPAPPMQMGAFFGPMFGENPPPQGDAFPGVVHPVIPGVNAAPNPNQNPNPPMPGAPLLNAGGNFNNNAGDINAQFPGFFGPPSGNSLLGMPGSAFGGTPSYLSGAGMETLPSSGGPFGSPGASNPSPGSINGTSLANSLNSVAGATMQPQSPGGATTQTVFPMAQGYTVQLAQQTRDAINAAVARAQQMANSYPAAVASRTPGAQISASTVAGVQPAMAMALAQGALAQQQIPFQDALANQENLLGGQVLQNQGANELANIGQQTSNAYNNALAGNYSLGISNALYGAQQNIARQNQLSALLANLYGMG